MRYLVLFTLLYSTMGLAQVNPSEYLTVEEIFDLGAEQFQNEDYDKAYETFLQVNYNDTAYFESRHNALKCLSAESKYDTIAELCREVLDVRKYNPKKELFTNSLGHALIQREKYEEALKHIDKALKEFPKSYLLRFNRASSLHALERSSEAVEELQMSIRYNPTYFASHLKLGAICAEAGDISKAAMCLNMALFLEATEKSAVTIIGGLEALYSGTIEETIKDLKYREEEEFDEIDLMIKNKLAENPKYKVKVKLNYKIIKQNHLLFENIQYDPDSKGFWNQTYVQFFKEIYNRGDFANFSYMQLLSLEDSYCQSVIAKKKTKIMTFLKWSVVRFVEIMNERSVWDGENYVENNYNHFGNYGFNQIVKMEGDKKVGDYTSYHSNGLLESKGQFSDNGLINGLWYYYDDRGRLETTANFKDEQLDGERISYYTNGSKSKVLNIKDNRIVGTVDIYYPFNKIYSKQNYNDDAQKDGLTEYFYKTGEVSHKINYSNDKLDGDYLEYYRNGQLKSELKYEDGEATGLYKEYHEDGSIRAEGKFENGVEEGHWKFVHQNGQIEEEGDFKAGYRIGLWKLYTADAKLVEETNYGETGKKTGVYKGYNIDGQLDLEFTYKGEEIISYTTYDAKGNVLVQREKKKRELEFIDYHKEGVVRVEGNYVKGQTVGTWKHYNEFGILVKELNYNDDGELDGDYKLYFDNGQVEKIIKYKDGLVDGYFVDYYRNGNIYKHGWYVEGEPVGEWEYFYKDGQLRTTEYYLEGEVQGELKLYDEKGRIDEISIYHYGIFEGVLVFDSLGNQVGEYMLKEGEGDFEFKDQLGVKTMTKTYKGGSGNGEVVNYFSNGKISSKGVKVNNKNQGDWKWYFRNGQLATEGNFDDGDREGVWKWYYESGKLKIESFYKNGLEEGTSIRYYENGQKESEKNYRYDERHGESIYYDESGEIQVVRFYKDGEMLGYTYLGKDGKRLEMIPFNKFNGTIEAYFKSGVKSYESTYEKGFSEGKTVYYHSSGKVADERVYEKDLLNGKYKEFFPNGKLRKEIDYKEGDEHGVSKEYYENGKLKSVKQYIMGELYGWSRFYNESGELTEEIFYYNGRELT